MHGMHTLRARAGTQMYTPTHTNITKTRTEGCNTFEHLPRTFWAIAVASRTQLPSCERCVYSSTPIQQSLHPSPLRQCTVIVACLSLGLDDPGHRRSCLSAVSDSTGQASSESGRCTGPPKRLSATLLPARKAFSPRHYRSSRTCVPCAHGQRAQRELNYAAHVACVPRQMCANKGSSISAPVHTRPRRAAARKAFGSAQGLRSTALPRLPHLRSMCPWSAPARC
jgi:hypothetical protein